MFARELTFNFRNKLPRNTLSFPSFNLRYEKNNLGKLQVAVVVSKKIDKRATVRNRLKRVLLEVLRKQLSENDNLSLVFYLKKPSTESLLISKEVTDAINKIKNV